jgi:ABC-type nitrate/sulfonate/bicarbonate transport system ATPase subunit
MTTTSMVGTGLKVDRVSKTFSGRDGAIQALESVSFTVSDGEFYSIVGPSGCGKSTLLNIIAGLDAGDAGWIALPDSPEDRENSPAHAWQSEHLNPSGPDHPAGPNFRLGRVAYMPQKDLLLPWRSVLDNASLGLELTGVPRSHARQRASELLHRFGLGGFERSYPAELSGGMRQRVAFLRTILTDRSLVLLDEPFGALDALTRRSMQEWLLSVWSELNRTVVLITHDVEEAIFLSDRVAVMSNRPGRIVAEYRIDLPESRHPDLVVDPAFTEIKRHILARLRENVEEQRDVSQ